MVLAQENLLHVIGKSLPIITRLGKSFKNYEFKQNVLGEDVFS